MVHRPVMTQTPIRKIVIRACALASLSKRHLGAMIGHDAIGAHVARFLLVGRPAAIVRLVIPILSLIPSLLS
jgi:hypothetical protein